MSSDSKLDDLSPLTREEWDFEAVPDGELVACCLWEYARESESIHRYAEYIWCLRVETEQRIHGSQSRPLTPRQAEMYGIYKGRISSSGFDHGEFSASLYETDYPWIGIYSAILDSLTSGILPWQRQPRELRQDLCAKVSQSEMLKPLVMAQIADLEACWEKNREPLDEARQSKEESRDENIMCAGFEASHAIYLDEDTPNSHHAKATAAFTVDFSRFTDAEITEAFKTWLESNRPEAWKNPKRVFPDAPARGSKRTEFRVALERLGLMRLLHRFYPKQLAEVYPEAWKRYGSKEDAFRRELRSADKFFHRLFPFLPAHERMERSERIGVWLPSMLKIAKEVEQEMNLSGGQ